MQTVNGYAFNVKRLSLMMPAIVNSGTNNAGPTNNVGLAAYEGDQVFVIASSLANAMAVLATQYGSDLGPVSGGATPIWGALTTMTGN